jgi:hypothetical protein
LQLAVIESHFQIINADAPKPLYIYDLALEKSDDIVLDRYEEIDDFHFHLCYCPADFVFYVHETRFEIVPFAPETPFNLQPETVFRLVHAVLVNIFLD